MAENQRRENLGKSPKIPGIAQSFLSCLIKRKPDTCMLLDAKIILEWAFHFVKFDGCKTAEMKVGAHLGPILEILMDNLP